MSPAHSPVWKEFTTLSTFSLVETVPGHLMLEDTCRRFRMQHLTPSSGYITRNLVPIQFRVIKMY